MTKRWHSRKITVIGTPLKTASAAKRPHNFSCSYRNRAMALGLKAFGGISRPYPFYANRPERFDREFESQGPVGKHSISTDGDSVRAEPNVFSRAVAATGGGWAVSLSNATKRFS
jgi:hypothetical protein